MMRLGVDALRMYLSGASVDGGEQGVPDESRGRFRSSVKVQSLLALTSGTGLANVVVEFAAGANGPGSGVLQAAGDEAVRWAAPGGALGAAVDISNGETVVVADGLNGDRYLRVRRTSIAPLSGSLNVALSDRYGNAVGMAPVNEAGRAAGLVQYRLLVMRNEAVGVGEPLRNLRFWLEAGAGSVLTPGVYTEKLGGAGGGTIQPSGRDFRDWPASGWALIETGAGREVVYYASRTFEALSVASGGRGLCGTAAIAMTDASVLVPWHGVALALDEADDPVDGEFQGWDGSEWEAPSGLSWRVPRIEAGAEVFGVLENLEMMGVWLRWDVPPGAAGNAGPGLRVLRVGFEGLPS